MALIIEAELAELRGRSDLARDHLERARDHAREHGASSVLALSQLQRAAWFSRREQSAERDAAFAEALATYDDWGALAIAARLRSLGPAAVR